jgi:hypothetical protein
MSVLAWQVAARSPPGHGQRIAIARHPRPAGAAEPPAQDAKAGLGGPRVSGNINCCEQKNELSHISAADSSRWKAISGPLEFPPLRQFSDDLRISESVFRIQRKSLCRRCF